MAAIDEIHDFIKDLARKERDGFIADEEIDMYLHRSQMECFREYFKLYGETQEIHDAMIPFKATWQFTKVDTPNGLITYPDDYVHLLEISITGYDNVLGQTLTPVRYVNEDQLANAVGSALRKPTATKPVGVDKGKKNADGIYDTYTQLYPKQEYAGEMLYIRQPLKPKYSYTQEGRVITYDPITSIQLEWSEPYVSNIVAKAVMYLGLNLDDKDIVQFGQIESK